MSKALLLSFLALLSGAAFSQEAKPALPRQNVAIVGARIEVAPGKVIPKGTVVIRDGKIVEVSAKTEAPSGVDVVKADGMTLYAGFIDAFRTSGIKSPPDPTQDGKPADTETAPSSMWIGNRKGINAEWPAAENLEIDNEQAAHKAGITTALLCPRTGNIRGAAAIVGLLPAANKERIVDPDFAMGFSFRSGTGAGYPNNILGLIALMRQTMYDVRSMIDGTVLSEEVSPPAWLKSLEALRPVLANGMPVLFEANMEREMHRAFRIADEFGMKLIIAGARDAYLMAPVLALKNIPVLLAAEMPEEPSIEPPSPNTPPADVTPMGYRMERREMWEKQSRGAEELAKAGVLFAFSSEGGSAGELLANVRKLISRGLSRDVALQALTTNPAKILGIDSQAGSIEVGKRADLVLMTGDFADAKTTVKRVWIDGCNAYEVKEEGK